MWTSGAQIADLGMLLARTDPDVPKHAGISYFGVDMDQPGMDIRPLREMTGRALFNEVFMTDVRVADADLLGGLNNGWAVANTTLANERAGLGAGGGGAAGGAIPGTKAGILERRVGDFVTAQRSAAGSGPAGSQRHDAGRPGPRTSARSTTPTLRQDLMRLYTLNEIARYTNLRAKAAKAAGRGPGPEANTAKLSMSRITRLSRDLGLAIVGRRRHAHRAPTPRSTACWPRWRCSRRRCRSTAAATRSRRTSSASGCSGLPSEPRTDKGVPFKELKVGTQAG